MQLLKNKNILLAVTGSIAVYKSLELIRLYIKAGANVRVIMTTGALKFINKLTFETISQNQVLDENSEDWSLNTLNNHIAIGKWADIFVIAPCSANTINKLSYGNADNLLLQTALAYNGIKMICPAANTNMISNPITQKSLEILKEYKYTIVNTTTKELACKDIGDGALANIEDIFNQTAKELLKEEYWINREIIINGGGSIEKIDEVRFISNFSSGKMATSIVKALYYKGANITFIKTPSCLNSDISTINELLAHNTSDMLSYINTAITQAKENNTNNKKPYFFGVAAISDYIVEESTPGKLKKEVIGNTWNLKLKQNIDVINSINKKDIYTIGFKAEMDKDNAKNNASNMLKNKNLSAVCLNILDTSNNFGSNENAIELISANTSYKLALNDKLTLSFDLLDNLKVEFNED